MALGFPFHKREALNEMCNQRWNLLCEVGVACADWGLMVAPGGSWVAVGWPGCNSQLMPMSVLQQSNPHHHWHLCWEEPGGSELIKGLGESELVLG